MRTPSLRARMVFAGVAVMAVILLALDTFLYVNLRSSLQRNLEDLLDDRAGVVRVEARMHRGPALARRLTALGLRAVIRTPDGEVYVADPPSPGLGTDLPTADPSPGDPQVSRVIKLPGGSEAVVFARRGGVDRALRRLLVLEAAGTVAALAAAALFLLRVAAMVLQPLEHVAAVARRRAADHTGERLQPDRPHTRIGQMAVAYDAMLDELEATLAEAQAAEARSRRMGERSRKIIETATDAFASVDVNGAIVDWNEGAEQVFGWPAGVVVGQDLFDTIFPEHLRDQHRRRLDQLRATGERRRRGRRMETAAQRRDGTVFDAELVLWASGSGPGLIINAFVHDVTDRRQAEAAVHRLAAIVDSSDDAVIGTTLDGVVTTWNPAAERIYGYTAAEMIGMPVSRLVPPDRKGELADAIEAVARGEAVSNYETQRLPKHGGTIDVAITVSPIRDATGAVTGASAITRDITEHRWLATTLDSTLSALETALDEARASEARSRRFLADAAHQLRTPIAGIRACAETLLRGASVAERDRLLADLVRETSRASRLMASLLQMARLDQGQALAPTACDLVELCRDEAGRARLLAPDLEIVVTADGPGRPQLDPRATKEIVANLLDNARRHARRRVEVTVGAAPGGRGVEVRVADDGDGVPAGMEEQIFDRFVSLDGRGGSGLGLAIARSLAEAGGGGLVYEQGAFVLRFPAEVSPGRPAVPPPVPPGPAPNGAVPG
ncbi:MAG: PAS domain-containing sensor histidine kinase [Acidimicrobiales bacterium]